MTEYVPVDLQHVKHGEWLAYVPRYDMFVTGTSRPRVEHETFRVLEEAFGLRSFTITWAER